jgi:hypothetical protein
MLDSGPVSSRVGSQNGSSLVDQTSGSRALRARPVFGECGPRPEDSRRVHLVRRSQSLCTVRGGSDQARRLSPPKDRGGVFPIVGDWCDRMACLVSTQFRGASIRTFILGSTGRSGAIRHGRLGPQGAVDRCVLARRPLAVPPHASPGAFASLPGLWSHCVSNVAFALTKPRTRAANRACRKAWCGSR